MIVLTPVICCTIAMPKPTSISFRTQGTDFMSCQPPSFSRSSLTARAETSLSSTSARCRDRTCRSTSSASENRLCEASQRGLSGMTSIPNHSTTAGIVARTSIQRHTPPDSPPTRAMTALEVNASNCPLTIISSLRVTSAPRRSAGEISARYTGTVTDAPPTARPSTNRARTITAVVGASVQASAPTKKSTARVRIVRRRPRASDNRPPATAPSAAPSSSELVTMPSVTGVRPRSSVMYGRAPLMTPVS